MDFEIKMPQLAKQKELLGRFEKTHRKNLNDAGNESISILQRRARQVVPVDTGWLKNHILADNPEPLVWRLEARTDYARVVEYGFKGRRPKPYLGRAVREKRNDINRVFKKAIEKTLEQTAI